MSTLDALPEAARRKLAGILAKLPDGWHAGAVEELASPRGRSWRVAIVDASGREVSQAVIFVGDQDSGKMALHDGT